ncbi:MAG: hypothetical protein D6785_16465 [Planctomycetota bacterium]|nr:MAG: hypothetical protein D6785_16465 [Planctomycetota bacterium]
MIMVTKIKKISIGFFFFFLFFGGCAQQSESVVEAPLEGNLLSKVDNKRQEQGEKKLPPQKKLVDHTEKNIGVKSAGQKSQSRYFHWCLNTANPFFSKRVLEESRLRFEHLQSLFKSKMVTWSLPEIKKSLNQTLLQEGDITCYPLSKSPKPFLALLIPYILTGKPCCSFSMTILGGCILESFSIAFEFAKNEKEELVLYFPKEKSILYCRDQWHFQILKENPSGHKIQSLTLSEWKGLYYYQLARGALYQKELSLARAFLEKAFSQDSKNPYILKAYGAMLIRDKEQADLGLKYLEQAMKALPEDPELLEILGDYYYQTRDFHKACSCYEKAWKVSSLKRIAFSLGRTYFQRREFQKALKILKPLIHSKKKLDRFKGLLLRGNIYLAQKNEKEGIKDLKQAIQLIPQKSAAAWGTLAEYYFQQKNYFQALQSFKKYVEVETERSYKLRALKKIEEIKELLKSSKNLSPKEMENALSMKDESARMEKLKLLQLSKDPKRFKVFLKALKDPSPGVRALGIRYLAQENEKYRKRILSLIRDKSYLVRGEVLFCLKNWQNMDDLPLILPYLKDPHPYVREAALKALQEICAEMDDYGYSPQKPPEKQKKAILKWKKRVEKEMQ